MCVQLRQPYKLVETTQSFFYSEFGLVLSLDYTKFQDTVY